MLMNIFENKLLQVILLPLSLLYRLIIFLRNKGYDWKIFHSWKLPCSVICVGNITVGGTGKTPVVEFLAKYLIETGHNRVAILSRGYKRESSGTVIVSDGKNLLTSAKYAGDEPFLLASRLQSVPVVVDEDRVRGGKTICSRFQPDFIILDDGYQHRRLIRDVNIAVVNEAAGLGNGRLLPAGPLREPLSALKRADLIWVNQKHPGTEWANFPRGILKYLNRPIIFSDYQPDALIAIPSGKKYKPQFLHQKRVVAFSGIANPDRFMKLLSLFPVKALKLIPFKDHHVFTPADFEKVQNAVNEMKADIIVTTEKDFTRIPLEISLSIPLYYLKIELRVTRGIEQLPHFFNVRKKY